MNLSLIWIHGIKHREFWLQEQNQNSRAHSRISSQERFFVASAEVE